MIFFSSFLELLHLIVRDFSKSSLRSFSKISHLILLEFLSKRYLKMFYGILLKYPTKFCSNLLRDSSIISHWILQEFPVGLQKLNTGISKLPTEFSLKSPHNSCWDHHKIISHYFLEELSQNSRVHCVHTSPNENLQELHTDLFSKFST